MHIFQLYQLDSWPHVYIQVICAFLSVVWTGLMGSLFKCLFSVVCTDWTHGSLIRKTCTSAYAYTTSNISFMVYVLNTLRSLSLKSCNYKTMSTMCYFPKGWKGVGAPSNVLHGCICSRSSNVDVSILSKVMFKKTTVLQWWSWETNYSWTHETTKN